MGSTAIGGFFVSFSLESAAKSVRIWRRASMKHPDSRAMRCSYESALVDFGREVMRHRMMTGHIAAIRGWAKS